MTMPLIDFTLVETLLTKMDRSYYLQADLTVSGKLLNKRKLNVIMISIPATDTNTLLIKMEL